MVIRTRFDIGQDVGIIDLKNKKATIYQIRIDGKNLIYDVEYWLCDEKKTVCLWEHQLSEQVNEIE